MYTCVYTLLAYTDRTKCALCTYILITFSLLRIMVGPLLCMGGVATPTFSPLSTLGAVTSIFGSGSFSLFLLTASDNDPPRELSWRVGLPPERCAGVRSDPARVAPLRLRTPGEPLISENMYFVQLLWSNIHG